MFEVFKHIKLENNILCVKCNSLHADFLMFLSNECFSHSASRNMAVLILVMELLMVTCNEFSGSRLPAFQSLFLHHIFYKLW